MYAEGTKVCSGCELEKPLSHFSNRKSSADGKQGECKSCRLQRGRNYKRKLRALDPVCASAMKAAEKYDITKDEAIHFLLVPCCQACGAPLDQGGHRIDHCHDLGHVRGVLCHPCNVACAGPSDEAAKRLSGCVEYLTRDVERLA